MKNRGHYFGCTRAVWSWDVLFKTGIYVVQVFACAYHFIIAHLTCQLSGLVGLVLYYRRNGLVISLRVTAPLHLNGSPGFTHFLELYFCTLFVPISPLTITCHCFGFALCSGPPWPPHLWGFCLLCISADAQLCFVFTVTEGSHTAVPGTAITNQLHLLRKTIHSIFSQISSLSEPLRWRERSKMAEQNLSLCQLIQLPTHTQP